MSESPLLDAIQSVRDELDSQVYTLILGLLEEWDTLDEETKKQDLDNAVRGCERIFRMLGEEEGEEEEGEE